MLMIGVSSPRCIVDITIDKSYIYSFALLFAHTSSIYFYHGAYTQ